ncbi:glycosyltransferase family 2 protein [Calditrichota bacterium]
MTGSENIRLSVVIPFFNEEGSLEELHKRLADVCTGDLQAAEFIFIDDGSSDKSNAIIVGLKNKDPRIRLITFRRNMGKSEALAIGFKQARGEYVATMDADLQDDPAELPGLIDQIEDGYDLVSGWKKVRHDPITKTIPSKLFNAATARLSGVYLHDFNCGLKMYRNQVIKEVVIYGERHRFIPMLAHERGFRVGEKVVKHHRREHGKTKFGAYRFIAGFFDFITLWFRMKYLSKPMHLFGTLGLISLLIGVGIIGYLSIGWFMGIWIGNRPILLIGVLAVVTGVQLFTMGLLSEMIAERSPHGDPPLREDSDIDLPQT